MGVITSVDQMQQLNDAIVQKYRRQYSASQVNTNSQNDASVFNDIETDSYCTDGSDDGKVSFWDGFKSVATGIGKSVLNMVTGAIKNPIKTIAMVGLCCVPVVGPIAIGYFAANGIINGVSQVISSIDQVNNAKTDAEAKLALESIGSGAFQTGASVLGLKGAGSLLKSQLSSSSVVATIKSGGSVGEVTGAAIGETAKNMGSVVKAFGKKITGGAEAVKGIYKGIKQEGGFTSYVKGKYAEFKVGAKNRIEDFASETQKKIDNFGKDSNGTSFAERVRQRFSRSGRQARQESLEAAAKKLKELKTNPNVKKNGSNYEHTTTENGIETTSTYDARGLKTQEVIVEKTVNNGVASTRTTTVKYNSSGAKVSTRTVEAPIEGSAGAKVETVEKFGKLGSHKTTVKAETPNADGTTMKTVETDKTGIFGNKVARRSETLVNADGKTIETYSSKLNQNTGVYSFRQKTADSTTSVRGGNNGYRASSETIKVDGKSQTTNSYALGDATSTTSKLSLLEKAKMFKNTTDLGVYADKFVGKPKAFESNPFYTAYSWYEATKEE